jgi:antitoxin (DNA-binding transcriptional repressor) of toxin-antitoxin stability system
MNLRLTPIQNELYGLTDRTGEFMNDGIVVSALDARTNFGKLLRRVEDEGRSLVIEKRGSPRADLRQGRVAEGLQDRRTRTGRQRGVPRGADQARGRIPCSPGKRQVT